jgi:hypothetical protein
MPKGKYLSDSDRFNIHRHLLTLNCTVDDIFYRDTEKISFLHLQKLCARLLNPIFADSFLCGTKKRLGRKRLLNREELILIPEIALEMQHKPIRKMWRKFIDMYYQNPLEQHLSLSTFKRTLKDAGLTRKVMERRHIFRDDFQGIEFLDRICHVNPLLLIDIDEISSSPVGYFNSIVANINCNVTSFDNTYLFYNIHFNKS